MADYRGYRVHAIDGKLAPGYEPPSMSLNPPPDDLAGLAAREDAARPAQSNVERPDGPHPTPHTPEGAETPTGGVEYVLFALKANLPIDRYYIVDQIETVRTRADEARQHAATDRRALLDTLAVVTAERDKLRAELADLRDGAAADTITRALDRRVVVDVNLRIKPEGT